MKTGLQARIAIFFVVLMLAVQLIALWATNTVTAKNAREVIRERLVTGERVFERVLEQNRDQLVQAARVLSADFAFREAVATSDRETITSVLANHGGRINASLAALIGLDRRIIADTLGTPPAGRESALQSLVVEAEEKGQATGVMQVETGLYQLVVVPVRAPERIGWIVIGLAVDNSVAAEIKRIVGLEVSFATRRDDGPWRLQASTLAPALQPHLLAQFTSGGLQFESVVDVSIEGEQLVTLASKLPRHGGAEVVAVLQESLESALAPVRRLQRGLLLLSVLAIAISILGSIFIARNLARPVRSLSEYAKRIEGGDYSEPPRIARSDELGDLAVAFDHMRQGLATRESRILELAHRDTLTGLPNRALFHDRIQQAIASSTRLKHPLSVLTMDLDHFKYVNDTLGHHYGDLLLQEVGKRLEAVARRDMDTVARLGGDEFAVLLPADDGPGALKLARVLLQALEAPMTLEGHVVDIRASIGIATFPEHGDDLITLMRHADIAMYVAKQNKTGVAAYDVRSHIDNSARLSLMGELRTAVEQNQLMLYYQPKVSFADPGGRHVEALVRWMHPQRGFVSPDDFIPYAEQTGYIQAVTRWVLNEAARQSVAWDASGWPIDISVNISARDLMNPEFPEACASILRRNSCDPARIVLEITESAMLDDPERALTNLLRLRELGSHLSIDDYGTGYSCLAHLKRLPVSELKIDRSFVMGMETDPSDATIVRSTIDLAHNMGLKVVAEGVENEGIFDLLRQLGCDMGQGYALSRPLDGPAILKWMQESPWINGGAEAKKAPKITLVS